MEESINEIKKMVYGCHYDAQCRVGKRIAHIGG